MHRQRTPLLPLSLFFVAVVGTQAPADSRPAPAPRSGVVLDGMHRSGKPQDDVYEAAGAAPLREEFDRLAAVKDAAGLARAVARLHDLGVTAAFRFGPRPDLKNSKRMLGALSQGGLGLPDRDYYLKTDAKTKDIRA